MTSNLVLQTGCAKPNCVIILFTQPINCPFRLATSAEKLEQQLKILPRCLTCEYHWSLSNPR